MKPEDCINKKIITALMLPEDTEEKILVLAFRAGYVKGGGFTINGFHDWLIKKSCNWFLWTHEKELIKMQKFLNSFTLLEKNNTIIEKGG